MPDLQNLRTTLGSLSLINPFILASGPPTATGDMIRRAFKAGWAGAVIKTIVHDRMDIKDLSPRFAAWRDESGEISGFENIELLSKKTLTYWTREISAIKKEFPHNILIASIMGNTNPETWQDLARAVQDAGADAIELNVSCPHGMPEAGLGSAIGQNPIMITEFTRAVCKVAQIPVYVKLTPNITDICPAACAVSEGGADGICAINSVQSLLGIDIETFEPLPSVAGSSTYGGYSGPAIKPVGLRIVSQIAKTIPLPIMGIGGICTWEDATQYMLVGASAVQVCTAVMCSGYGVVREMKTGLSAYLKRKNLQSPDELVGRTLPLLTSHQNLSRIDRIRPVIKNQDACIRCGTCVIACRDGGYQAIKLTDDGPVVDLSRCDGCGLCILVCSVKALIAHKIRV